MKSANPNSSCTAPPITLAVGLTLFGHSQASEPGRLARNARRVRSTRSCRLGIANINQVLVGWVDPREGGGKPTMVAALHVMGFAPLNPSYEAPLGEHQAASCFHTNSKRWS